MFNQAGLRKRAVTNAAVSNDRSASFYRTRRISYDEMLDVVLVNRRFVPSIKSGQSDVYTESHTLAMQCLSMETIKRSFSFGTNIMEVGTPTFSQGFKVSPPKQKTQPTSPAEPMASTHDSAQESSWPCISTNEDLFCLEELVWSAEMLAFCDQVSVTYWRAFFVLGMKLLQRRYDLSGANWQRHDKLINSSFGTVSLTSLAAST